MSTLPENIKRIQDKLQLLLKNYQLLQKENAQLKIAVKELKSRQENDLILLHQLEQQVGILKSGAGKMNETDKKLFEKHLNQYIKEIDKCIGLLSE